jgi:hypothetical protein
MFLSSDGSTSIVTDLTVIHSDAYSGYGEMYKDPAREVTEVACWAHAIRRFCKA